MHKPNCNIIKNEGKQCAVYHNGKPCDWHICNCSSETPQENKGCCEKCKILRSGWYCHKCPQSSPHSPEFHGIIHNCDCHQKPAEEKCEQCKGVIKKSCNCQYPTVKSPQPKEGFEKQVFDLLHYPDEVLKTLDEELFEEIVELFRQKKQEWEEKLLEEILPIEINYLNENGNPYKDGFSDGFNQAIREIKDNFSKRGKL